MLDLTWCRALASYQSLDWRLALGFGWWEQNIPEINQSNLNKPNSSTSFSKHSDQFSNLLGMVNSIYYHSIIMMELRKTLLISPSYIWRVFIQEDRSINLSNRPILDCQFNHCNKILDIPHQNGRQLNSNCPIILFPSTLISGHIFRNFFPQFYSKFFSTIK